MATNGNGSLVQQSQAQAFELALVGGDLSRLSTEERLGYYKQTCESIGLNPLTKPFEYINLNGKLVMYAKKDCTDQLRSIRKVSVRIMGRETIDGVYVVTAQASLPDGRVDESTGAVYVANLKGEALANAFMKTETKAKRRATLSICGLGMLDETEIETIPGARVDVEPQPKRLAPAVSQPEQTDEEIAQQWEKRITGTTTGLAEIRKEFKSGHFSQFVQLRVANAYEKRRKELNPPPMKPTISVITSDGEILPTGEDDGQ